MLHATGIASGPGAANASCAAALPRVASGRAATATVGSGSGSGFDPDPGSDPATARIAVGDPPVTADRSCLKAGVATSDIASAAGDVTASNCGVFAVGCRAGA